VAQWLRAAGLPGRLGRQLNQRINELMREKKARKLVRCTCRAAGYSFVTLTTLNVSRLFVIQVQRQQEQQHRIWHTQFHCSVVSPNIQGGPNCTLYCKFTAEFFQWKNLENRLRSDRIMAMSSVSRFLAHPVHWIQYMHSCTLYSGVKHRITS